MSKLQKFNQILFAILGAGLILIIGITLFVVAKDFFSDWNRTNHAPLSNQEVKELVKDNRFKQTISYDSGYWAWTDTVTNSDGTKKTITSPYYIIPVSQSTLEKEHKLRKDKVIGYMDLENRSNYNDYSSYKYNNILIYNASNNSVKKIFDHRLFIPTIEVYKNQTEHFLFLETQGLSQTTDNKTDAVPTDFYVYKFANQELIKLNMPEMNFMDFITDLNLPFFLIHGKIDFDKNGTIDEHDPYRLFSWDLDTLEIKPFLSDAITDDLQRTLEGRNLTE